MARRISSTRPRRSGISPTISFGLTYRMWPRSQTSRGRSSLGRRRTMRGAPQWGQYCSSSPGEGYSSGTAVLRRQDFDAVLGQQLGYGSLLRQVAKVDAGAHAQQFHAYRGAVGSVVNAPLPVQLLAVGVVFIAEPDVDGVCLFVVLPDHLFHLGLGDASKVHLVAGMRRIADHSASPAGSPSIQTSPPSQTSFFQTGTASLNRSTRWWQASNAALRCGEETAMRRDVSPISRRPVRCCIATPVTGQRAIASSAICRITRVAISG